MSTASGLARAETRRAIGGTLRLANNPVKPLTWSVHRSPVPVWKFRPVESWHLGHGHIGRHRRVWYLTDADHRPDVRAKSANSREVCLAVLRWGPVTFECTLCGHGPRIQAMKLFRLDNPAMFAVGDDTAGLAMQPEGEFLGDVVRSPAQPWNGQVVSIEFDRAAAQFPSAMGIGLTQFAQQATDDAHVDGLADHGLTKVDGIWIEMSQGESMNQGSLPDGSPRETIARRMRRAPSLIGNCVSGASASATS